MGPSKSAYGLEQANTPIKIRIMAGKIVHTNSRVCKFPNTLTTKKLKVKE
jgi:hypothetical protein